MLAAGGCVVGAGRALPRSRRPASASTLILLVTAGGVALAGLLLEALFRAARLQSLQAYDAWAFWVPKAKAIYFFGGLDEQVFTTWAGPTYPPLVPIVDAAAFHAMGGADVVTFHLQFWFLAPRRRRRARRLLCRRVPAWLLWPSLLARPRRAALRRATADAAGGHPRRRPLRRRRAAARTVARDGRGWRLAAAAVFLAGATVNEARGPPVRGVRARRGARRLPTRAWARLAAAALAVRRATFPGASGAERHDISAARRPRRSPATASPTRRPLVRRVSTPASLWSLVPIVLLSRSARAASGATDAWRRISRFSASRSSAGSGHGRLRGPRAHGERGVNPIVRYTGVDRRPRGRSRCRSSWARSGDAGDEP